MNPLKNASKVVFIYFVFGCLWIFFTDAIIKFLFKDIQTYSLIQTYKGWAFVGMTSLLIFKLIYNDYKKDAKLNLELNQQNKELEGLSQELKNKIKMIDTTSEEMTLQNLFIDKIFEGTNAPIVSWNLDGTIVRVNQKFTQITGFENEAIVNKKWCDLNIHECEGMEKRVKLIMENSEIEKFEMKIDDRIISWNDKLFNKTSVDQPLVVSFGMDVTDERLNEMKIQHLIYKDQLTNLYNLNKFNQDLIEIITIGSEFNLLYIDIDNFKMINDIYGHVIGDELLIQMAKRLKEIFSKHLVYRWSGDEFFVVFKAEEKENLEDKLKLMYKYFEKKWQLEDYRIYSSVSVGIANYPNDGQTREELMRYVDLAIHRSKKSGKTKFTYFERELMREIELKVEIQNRVDEAIRNDEFNLFFQPIYNIKNQKIQSLEVLLRWNPEGFDVTTQELISIAEESDQILRIDYWVIKNAFSRLKENKVLFDDIVISINVSTKTFRSFDFISYLKEQVMQYRINPRQIKFEITEHSIFDDLNESIKTMNLLRSIGFKIALDDFGTKYSSLNYLARLPFDYLKVDKSYVDNIVTDNTQRKIVQSVVKLSNDIGIKAIAEGVETKEQELLMDSFGCEFAQGYYFAKPMDEVKLIELLRKQGNK